MANINDNNYTFSADTGVISRLDDNPNESDLDAAGLKAAFDAGATHVVTQINDDLIPAINARCDEIATSVGTTSSALGNISNLTTPVTTDAVSAINSVNTSLNSKTNDSGWITIVPTNGTAGTGYYVPQYRKIGKLVTMRGYITVKNNNAMFTLPEAYRPSARLTFSGTNDNRNVNEIRVTEGGDVRLLDTTGSLSSGVPCFLDNITYFID